VASGPPTNLKEIHMTKRDRCIAGVPYWAQAEFPDPKAAVEFNASMFGWEARDV